jgi:hypothetical protein
MWISAASSSPSPIIMETEFLLVGFFTLFGLVAAEPLFLFCFTCEPLTGVSSGSVFFVSEVNIQMLSVLL